MAVSSENARWFVYSGIFVAAAHGFLYSALAVAPIMLVAPLSATLLGLPLPLRAPAQPTPRGVRLRSRLGTLVSILGACAIAIDTQLILHALAIPEPLATYLRSPL